MIDATAPIRPEVVTAIAAALTATGNPSSVHAAGRAAKHRLEAARAEVAALLGAPSGAIVFTSGGTEANNQVLRGPWSSVLVSAIEHDSVLAPAEAGGKVSGFSEDDDPMVSGNVVAANMELHPLLLERLKAAS